MTGFEITIAILALCILFCINGNLARLASHHEKFPAPAPEPNSTSAPQPAPPVE